MRIEFPFILRSRIEDSITRARYDERERAERQSEIAIHEALEKQKGVYELKLKEKAAEIRSLESVVTGKEKYCADARKQLNESKTILLKAREVITACDIAYRDHTENDARTMKFFVDMRKELEVFSKNLIE